MGGDFLRIGSHRRDHIAALDARTGAATAWNPGANSSPLAFAVSGQTVYVGGYFTRIGGQKRNRIAALNARTGATTAWNPNANSSVWALAVSRRTVYAGGFFTRIGDSFRPGFAAFAPTGMTGALTQIVRKQRGAEESSELQAW